ncbi:MAG: hypothetical protein ACK4VP_08275, partial [Nitrospira sp.]
MRRHKKDHLPLVLCTCSLMVTLIAGTGLANAIERGEMVQKDGKWVFESKEDPVLKFLHDKQMIGDDDFYKTMDRTGKNWIEPADAVLNQRKDIDWIRYEKSLLHLPDWLDLAMENRTRFESYDHPWRSNQQVGNGRTDAQIAMRSRVRIGLGGDGPVKFLFEGQDSRSFMDKDPGD